MRFAAWALAASLSSCSSDPAPAGSAMVVLLDTSGGLAARDLGVLDGVEIQSYAADLPRALAETLGRFHGRPGHVIVVSDGRTLDAGLESSVRQLVKAGVTVSAVCVGSPIFDAPLMSQVADWGRGRFLFTHNPKSISKVIAQETRTARR